MPPEAPEAPAPVARCILAINRAGRITSLSEAARRRLATASGELPSTLREVPWADQQAVEVALEAAREHGTGVRLTKAVLPRDAGHGSEALDVEILPLETPDGRDSHVLLWLVRDPGESEVTNLFHQSFLHSHDAIEVTDLKGRYVDVNPAFERIYGYRRDEIIGQRPNLLRSPKTPSEVFRSLWQDISDPEKGRWSGEMINLDKAGHEHHVRLSVDAVRDRAGRATHFIGVATDVTEERRLELAAIRTERLASVGQLAAGVAHEVNTPLSNIQLIAESLRRRAPNPWVSARADAITTQVDAAARIVSALLDFTRSHPVEPKPFDLVDAATEAIEFIRGKRSPDVEITELRETSALPVRGNRVQLVQVCANLLNNAYDALEGKGRVIVRYRVVEGKARLSFEDNGPGIPAEVLPHIFEPFFTTKPVGQGTGLGLSICHGIVHAHRGEILVDTAPGKGTTFTIEIPLDGPTTPLAAPPAAGRARDPAAGRSS